MKLLKARVTNYKSIEDSGWVDIDDAVTDLVGKNESGKTAFLEAIEKLNPVDTTHASFDPIYDYPASRYTAYKRQHQIKPDVVVEAVYEMEDADRAVLVEALGEDAVTGSKITVGKDYANRMTWRYPVKETSSPGEDGAEDAEEEKGIADRAHELMESRFPRYFYFGDYQTMPGRISLDDLARRLSSGTGTVDETEQPFLALVRMIGSSVEELRDEVHAERLQRELEGASNHITDEMMEFWKQNEDLQVRFERKEANPDDPAPLDRGRVLEIRVYNPNHRVTVPFDQRSKGFRWFFSFLAYFQEMVNDSEERRTILLLDEPGLSLHGLAQQDFLRFIDARLAPEHQVIYTTHSPFMIDASNLDRVRTVFDAPGEGTKIGGEIFQTDRDTVFPLQAALGYSLAQTLFVGEHNLLLEGPSDMLYLEVLNAAVGEQGGEVLDERWVLVPTGGIDKIHTFATLFGSNQLHLVALVDVAAKDTQKLDNLERHGYLAKNGVLRVADFTDEKEADIEDLFEPACYLDLVNGAYAKELKKPITMRALPKGGPRIVKRIEQHFADKKIGSGRLNHYRPAKYLNSQQSDLVPKLSADTIERAGKLFKAINAQLK